MSAPLIILAITFAVQLIIPKTPARRGLFGMLVLVLPILAIFGFSVYQSWQQYLTWKSNDLGKLFLPPYQNWDYFVFFARTRFFNPYFLSLAAALVFLAAAKYFNKKYQERFFEPIEPYLLATAFFVVGHPLWLFYLIIFLIAALAGNSYLTYKFYRTNKSDKSYRISFYYFWLPAAISTILISKWLAALPWWQTLKF